jgi:hypothetical protein
MTAQDAIDILSEIKQRNEVVRDRPDVFFHGRDVEHTERLIMALDLAIPVLRFRQTNAKPLTLDELRKMDGAPVWVVPLPYIDPFNPEVPFAFPPFWYVLQISNPPSEHDYVMAKNAEMEGVVRFLYVNAEDYGEGKKWVAYREEERLSERAYPV